MVLSMIGNGATLALTVVTGVLTARLLHPSGRGEVAAIVAWAGLVYLLSSVSIREAFVYHECRRAAPASQVVGTAVAMVGVLAIAGIAASQVVVPLVFDSQGPEVVATARTFMVMALPLMGYEVAIGLLEAHQRFGWVAISRVALPASIATGIFLAWAADRVTVTAVLAIHTLSYTALTVALLALLVGRIGISAPSMSLARSALRYGVRVQGQTLGSLANSRLDVVVMPAVVTTTDIGRYSVAVSAASIIMPVFGQLKSVVFAYGARRDSVDAMPLVERTLRVVLIASAVAALLLALVAPVLVRVLYGADFGGAVAPLRLLLPGMIFWSGTSILAGGLNAVNRPASSSRAQLMGVAVTVIGLLVLLPSLGIAGAALTSSVAYTTVFVLHVRSLRAQPGFSASRALAPSRVAGDVRHLVRAVRPDGALPGG
jgi:O-antigen/teichoic acid export membrane protein